MSVWVDLCIYRGNFIITVQVKTIFQRPWQIATSQSNESHIHGSFSLTRGKLYQRRHHYSWLTLLQSHLNAALGMPPITKLLWTLTSCNSAPFPQVQLPQVTRTVSDFTWGRIIKMLKCQMAKAPVVETKQSLCGWNLHHSHGGQDSPFLEGWRKDRFTVLCTGAIHLLPLSSNKDAIRALTLCVRNQKGQNLFDSKQEKKNWHSNYDNWSSEVSLQPKREKNIWMK